MKHFFLYAILAPLALASIVAMSWPIIVSIFRREGVWGINAWRTKCPECGHPFPIIRWPANERQALWGGGTCARCGTEADKWGNRILKQPVEADSEST